MRISDWSSDVCSSDLDRARSRRRARLERHDYLCRRLLSRAALVGTRAALFAAHGQLALLARDARHRLLRRLDVGRGDHAGADVARIWGRWLSRLQFRRKRSGDAPDVSDPLRGRGAVRSEEHTYELTSQ